MALLRPLFALLLGSSVMLPCGARATQAKIDSETCTQLRLEQIKFRQSGILTDMEKGPDWAKANLSPDRLREIEHYLQLDEQVRFGCRDAKLSPDVQKLEQAEINLELPPKSDPGQPSDAKGGADQPNATAGAASVPTKKLKSHGKKASAKKKSQTAVAATKSTPVDEPAPKAGSGGGGETDAGASRSATDGTPPETDNGRSSGQAGAPAHPATSEAKNAMSPFMGFGEALAPASP